MPLVVRCGELDDGLDPGVAREHRAVAERPVAPQPAPEPLARTYAPQTITAKLKATTPHA